MTRTGAVERHPYRSQNPSSRRCAPGVRPQRAICPRTQAAITSATANRNQPSRSVCRDGAGARALRLPGRDGREPPVPRAAAAARPPGAARARSGRRGSGPRRPGEASAAIPRRIIKHTARFVTSSPAAGAVPVAVTTLARRSDPDDVACQAETAGRRRSGPDPRDRRGRRPGTPTARARGGAGTGQDRSTPDSRRGAVAVPYLAANRALAREQLALIDEALATAASLGPRCQNRHRNRPFRPVGTPQAGNASKGGSREGRDRRGVGEIYQRPEEDWRRSPKL